MRNDLGKALEMVSINKNLIHNIDSVGGKYWNIIFHLKIEDLILYLKSNFAVKIIMLLCDYYGHFIFLCIPKFITIFSILL